MTKLRHFDSLGTARFVTFSCHDRLPLLSDVQVATLVARKFSLLRDQFSMRIFAYVIMPEHVHLVVHPPDNVKLGFAIGRFKALSAIEALELVRRHHPTLFRELSVIRDGKAKHAFWMRRCYDHNCRVRHEALEAIKYCHNNPVERGLVQTAVEYPFSSCRWYESREEGLVTLDADYL